MSKNKVIKSVSFNLTNEVDAAILKAIKRRNFSGLVKKLLTEYVNTHKQEKPQEEPREAVQKTVEETAAQKMARMREQMKKPSKPTPGPNVFLPNKSVNR